MKKLSLILSFILCSSAGAVNTLFLEHNSEPQFKDGIFENIQINSQGIMSLAPASQTIETGDDDDWVINDLAADSKGIVYAATSGKGAVYTLTDDNKLKSIWAPGQQGNHVFSIAIADDDTILAGTGGAKGELFARSDKKFKKIWADDKVGYIWDIIISPTGKVYLATGPEGMIYATDLKGGSTEVIYDAPAKNILALALSPDGMLYAASDSSGLVYKIELATKNASVAYDTGKEEVSSLCLDKAGNVYIATAQSSAAKPGARLILSDNSEQPAAEKPQVQPQPMSDGDTEPKATAPATSKKLRLPAPQQPNEDSNLLLKLSPSGYVEKLFSAPVVIHDIKLNEDQSKILLATGIEGKLIALDLADNTSVEIFDSQSSQISALLLANNRFYAGCADKAALTILENHPAASGSFVSDTFDAKAPANWGLLYITGQNLTENIDISLRTGNTADPENGGWSNWTKAQLNDPAIKANIPVGRFLQYKLELKSTASGTTPTISEIKASYNSINLKPQISEFAIQHPNGKQKNPAETEPKDISFNWQAQDDNADKLTSDILIKSNTSTGWIKIADNLDDEQYTWDTTLVADGIYTIKLVVSDELDNPAGSELTAEKTTSGILVDNTAPEINALTISAENNAFLVKITASDALSVIERVEYSVDSDKTFRSATCDDGMSDSFKEDFSFTMTTKENGLHFVTIKVTDIAGNSKLMTKEFKN